MLSIFYLDTSIRARLGQVSRNLGCAPILRPQDFPAAVQASTPTTSKVSTPTAAA